MPHAGLSAQLEDAKRVIEGHPRIEAELRAQESEAEQALTNEDNKLNEMAAQLEELEKKLETSAQLPERPSR